jgi:glycosyltransferase involved in cell wall biosynthesis
MSTRLRIFVPSSAALLTDHQPHGEGLIAWSVFSGLADRGHEVVVCAREVALRSRPSFELVETGPASRWESLEPLAYARRVDHIYRSRSRAARFDVVHWLFPQGPDEVLFAPRGGVPFVIGPHSLPWPAAARKPSARPGDLVRFATRPLFSAAHRRALDAAAAIFVSVPAAASIFPERHRAKARVLPFGVDVSRFAPTPVPSDMNVVFVGRLDEAKGVRDLVESFARARMVLGEGRLILVGDGPDTHWIEAARERLGLNGSLELRGPLPHSGVAEILQRARVVCFPSRGEPFGMALVEAMAAGRPVLAADSGGPQYILRRSALSAGQLVPAGDVTALADALVDLLPDRTRLEAVAAENRRLVVEEFSLERMLTKLEAEFRALAR